LQKRERRQGPARPGKARQGPARPGKARQGPARRQGHPTDSLNVGKKMKHGWHFRIVLLGNSSTSYFLEGYLLFFFRGRFCFLLGSWFYAFLFL
jgi:hypothetical protein